MPFFTAHRISLRVWYGAALSLLAACATEPKHSVVPLKRAVELPIFIVEGQPNIVVGPLAKDIPEEGTRETTNAPRRDETAASKNLREGLRAGLGGVLLAPLLIPAIIAAEISEASSRVEQQRYQATYPERTKPLWDLLSNAVTRHLDEALVDAFKATLAWQRPNLTQPQWGEWYAPDQTLHTVVMPALELRVKSIQLIQRDPVVGAALVMCASAAVVGGAEYRTFETCRHETWQSARFSTLDEKETFIAKLTAASGRLGEAMAKGVISN